jgi:amino acid transporter
MDFLTVLGASGAALILVAFIMNQKHLWKDEYLVYDLVNFVGSALLVTYAILLKSYPFLVLNGVWALVSLRDIVADFKRNGTKKGGGFYKKWMQ